MNYSDLHQALQDYCETTETTFVNNIPVFVRQAEERINREVIIPNLKKTATGSFTTSQQTETKPSDLLSVSSFRITDGSSIKSTILKKDYSFIEEAYPDATNEGLPKYYADLDDATWVFAPIPDSTYAYDILYEYDPTTIVTGATSWLGDNAESALLYGCLVEAYTFLKGDADLLQLYEARYKEAINQLVQLGVVRHRSDDNRPT